MKVLEVNNLTKKFGGFAAVNDLSFDLEPGKVTSIIGPNGAGKTTAIRLISGELDPTEGEIIFKGKRITKSSISRHALLGISRTFQVPSVFNGLSVIDNLRTAARVKGTPTGNGADKCRQILEEVGMLQDMHVFPNELSHHKKRILEWCMSVVQEPDVLLMDELGAGLADSELSMLYDLIKEKADTITPLFVEHRLEFVFRISDKVIVLNQGKKLAEGSPDEIRNNEEVKVAYCGDDYCKGD
jgi:ABC-type branched-subunit amino acid transport system ATPase component